MFTPTRQPPRTKVGFCRHCGHATVNKVPTGDGRERAVCPACGTIHYVNPLVVVGTIPTWEDRVLLCRRAIEPRRDKWTLPAGFMELGETCAQGAARETVEEAGAHFEMGPLFAVISIPRVGQVHLFYRCTLENDRFDPGDETLEARLFDEADIPWDELAFHTVRETLTRFFSDRRAGQFGMHAIDLSDTDFLPAAKRVA